MILKSKKRFLIALFNLCLDRNYKISGAGVEDWSCSESLPHDREILGLLYDATNNYFCIDSATEIHALRDRLESLGKNEVWVYLESPY